MKNIVTNEKPTLFFCIQYYKHEVNLTNIMNQIKKDFREHSSETLKNLDVYVKAEDNAAYYVANNSYESKIDLWNMNLHSADTCETELDLNQNIVFQFRGKEIDANGIIRNILNAMHTSSADVPVKELEVYAKIDDETVYYLVNNYISKKLPLC